MRRADALLLWITSPRPRPKGPWDRWDTLAVVLALVVLAWLFAFKMETFLRLGTTSDLYHSIEYSRSWLEGRPYADNEFGDILNTHSYFLAAPLGLVSKPFGAPGLLFTAALGAALAAWGSARLLRTLDVSGPVAAVAGTILVAMPMSAVFFYHPTWAFQWELYVPPLAVGLLYGLIHRRFAIALPFALALVSVKEEMPLLVALLAFLVVLEETFRGERGGGLEPRWASRWNRPALACLALAVVSLPILLWIVKTHPGGRYSVGSFARLPVASKAGVKDTSGLASFFVAHWSDWLHSDQVKLWPGYMLLGSLGLLALRPQFLPFGIGLTIISWLMQDQILWPIRFATSLAFAWCVALLGFASLWRLGATLAARPAPARHARVALGVGFAVVASWLMVKQARLEPQSLEVYRMDPWSYYTPAERADADALFARYRAEGKTDEPVIAGHFLFRYAHDRALYWYWALDDKPRPVWILWDRADGDFARFGLPHADYEALGERGRFSLWKRLPGR